MTKIIPSDPTGEFKRKIKRQHRLYSNFKKRGYREEDKVRVDAFREECNQLILGGIFSICSI